MSQSEIDEVLKDGGVQDKKDPKEKSQYQKLKDVYESCTQESFRSTTGETYVYTNENNLLDVNSQSFRVFIACRYEDEYKAHPTEKSVKDIANSITDKCTRQDVRETFIRVGYIGQSWYYNLADGKSVEISKGSWSIVDTPPIFPSSQADLPQAHPDKSVDSVTKAYGTIDEFIQMLNFNDIDQYEMFFFMLVSCFIPNIKHPLILVEGPMGSAKSTFAEIVGAIVSPSGFGHIGHDTTGNIALQFSKRYFRSLDNVSEIGNAFSDVLCKAATGGEYTKRALYTDSDEISMRLDKGITMLNGIGIAGRPDMNERSIIMRLSSLSGKQKTSRNFLDKKIEDIKPRVLGAIFTILAETRKIQDDRINNDIYRMSDFTSWSRLVSRELHGSEDVFEKAMLANDAHIKASNEESNSFFGYVVIEVTRMLTISGTTQEVFDKLMASYFEKNSKHGMPDEFPSSPNRLKQKLTRIESMLKDEGIEFGDAGYRNFEIKKS